MSIISMTGFGSGRTEVNGVQLYAEISTVNRKQLEIRFNLPRDLAALETDLRKVVQNSLSRGMVSVRISKSATGSEKSGINRERVGQLIQAARELGREFNVNGELSIAQVLTLPGVFDEDVSEVSGELKNAANQVLEEALTALNNMRKVEGEALKQELSGRLELLEELRNSLLPYTSVIEEQIKQRLLDKLAESNLPIDRQDERFLKEVLYYADKADVTEELTRLASHFGQFKSFLDGAPGSGRSMDFLVQEMFREITTLGNKAGSGPVAAIVVKFKTELEKIREQIQNIE